MRPTELAPIENTLHKTHAWLNQIDAEMGWTGRVRAYHALRVVLHALRDRLTVPETVDLGAQLPMLIRGLYYEGWDPNGKPVKIRRKEEFLEPIAAAFQDDPTVYPEAVAWVVFKVLAAHVTSGEIHDVLHVLPERIRALWPADVRLGVD